MIYFVEAEQSGKVKIGRAVDVAQRLRVLQIGSAEPLRLLAVLPGSGALERHLHSQLADLRSHGEWFHASPRITAAIDARRELEDVAGRTYPVLRRLRVNYVSDPCPFCGEPHRHGEGDGHRVAACTSVESRDVVLPDGRVLARANGYIVRTGLAP